MNPSSSMYKKGLIVLVLGIMMLSVGSGQKVLLNDTFDNNIDGWSQYNASSNYNSNLLLSHDSTNNKLNVKSNYESEGWVYREIPSYSEIGTDSYYNITYEYYLEYGLDDYYFTLFDSNENKVLGVMNDLNGGFLINGNQVDSVINSDGNYYYVELIGINESDNTIKEIKHDGSTVATDYNLDSSLDLSNIRYVGAGFYNGADINSENLNYKTDDVVVSTKVTNVNPVFNELSSTPSTTEWQYNTTPDIYYNVTDSDGNLDRVNLTVTKDGNYHSSQVVQVSGSEATGTVNNLFTINERDAIWRVNGSVYDTNDAEDSIFIGEYIPGLEYQNQVQKATINIKNGSYLYRGDSVNDAIEFDFEMNQQINNSKYEHINVQLTHTYSVNNNTKQFNMPIGVIDISSLSVGKVSRNTWDYNVNDINNRIWTEIEQNNSDVGLHITAGLEERDGDGNILEVGGVYDSVTDDGYYKYYNTEGTTGLFYETFRNVMDWFGDLFIDPIINVIGNIFDFMVDVIVNIALYVIDFFMIAFTFIMNVVMGVLGIILVFFSNVAQYLTFYIIDLDINDTTNNMTYENVSDFTDETNHTMFDIFNGDIRFYENKTQADVFDSFFGTNTTNKTFLTYSNNVTIYTYDFKRINSTKEDAKNISSDSQ